MRPTVPLVNLTSSIQPAPLLLQVKEGGDDELPLKVSCWPSREGPQSCLNLEYEATVAFDLLHVTIAIPCASAPKIAQVALEQYCVFK